MIALTFTYLLIQAYVDSVQSDKSSLSSNSNCAEKAKYGQPASVVAICDTPPNVKPREVIEIREDPTSDVDNSSTKKRKAIDVIDVRSEALHNYFYVRATQALFKFISYFVKVIGQASDVEPPIKKAMEGDRNAAIRYTRQEWTEEALSQEKAGILQLDPTGCKVTCLICKPKGK